MPKSCLFTLHIKSGNHAFQASPLDEVRRIVESLDWDRLESPGESLPLFDHNGNRVGTAFFDISKTE